MDCVGNSFLARDVRQDQDLHTYDILYPYLIFVIFFKRAKFLENKIYTEKTRKLRQNTQKIANFFALLRQNTQ